MEGKQATAAIQGEGAGLNSSIHGYSSCVLPLFDEMVGSIRRFLETTFCVSRDARMGAAVEVVLNDLVDAGMSPDAGLEAFVAVYSSSVVSTPLAPALGVLGSALLAAGLEAARHALGRGEDAIAVVAGDRCGGARNAVPACV